MYPRIYRAAAALGVLVSIDRVADDWPFKCQADIELIFKAGLWAWGAINCFRELIGIDSRAFLASGKGLVRQWG